jgi:hypothetical protein
MQREIESRGGAFVKQPNSGSLFAAFLSLWLTMEDYFIDFPSKGEDLSGASVRVTYMWLERCIEEERLVAPQESFLYVPFVASVRGCFGLVPNSMVTAATSAGAIQGILDLSEQF